MSSKKLIDSAKLLGGLSVYITEDDQKLMQLVQADNQKAFEKIFMKYKDRIFSFIKNMIFDQQKAEDLTHDVFMKVYEKRESYNYEYKFSTWIFTIARNTSIDYLRRKKEVSIGSGEQGENLVDLVEDQDINIEMKLIQQADKELVQKCLETLTIEQKEVLLLRLFSEESYEAISEIQEKTLSAVKSLINRAKKALVDCVRECMEGAC